MEAWLIDANLLRSSWKVDGDFLAELKAIMRRARTKAAFAITEEDKFRAACGAAAMCATGEDKAWLESQLTMLRKFAALVNAQQAGLRVDISSLLPIEEEHVPQRSYRLMELWRESKP